MLCERVRLPAKATRTFHDRQLLEADGIARIVWIVPSPGEMQSLCLQLMNAQRKQARLPCLK
jgi:hypothetical protein